VTNAWWVILSTTQRIVAGLVMFPTVKAVQDRWIIARLVNRGLNSCQMDPAVREGALLCIVQRVPVMLESVTRVRMAGMWTGSMARAHSAWQRIARRAVQT